MAPCCGNLDCLGSRRTPRRTYRVPTEPLSFGHGIDGSAISLNRFYKSFSLFRYPQILAFEAEINVLMIPKRVLLNTDVSSLFSFTFVDDAVTSSAHTRPPPPSMFLTFHVGVSFASTFPVPLHSSHTVGSHIHGTRIAGTLPQPLHFGHFMVCPPRHRRQTTVL